MRRQKIDEYYLKKAIVKIDFSDNNAKVFAESHGDADMGQLSNKGIRGKER